VIETDASRIPGMMSRCYPEDMSRAPLVENHCKKLWRTTRKN